MLRQGKRKNQKPPDLTILRAVAQRSEGMIRLDGHVKNTSLKPIEGLVLLFDFIEPGGRVVSTMRGAIDEELLEPAGEAPFRVETRAPPRSVQFRIQAEDGSHRELRVEPDGARPIE